MIVYLNANTIRKLHNLALERYGGRNGENEPGQIEFMAQKPSMKVYGRELYPGLFLKSAVYLSGFATRQFFVDGNKRTAYLVTATFLELNGFSLLVDDNDLFDTMLNVANGQMSEPEIAEWIEERVTKHKTESADQTD